MDKNFGLSPGDFDRIVDDLKKNETLFFEQVFLRHFKDCIDYLQKEYRADFNEAYDATMDTLLEFRKRLVEGKLHYGNLRYLFTKMASQIYIRQKKAFPVQGIENFDIELEVDNPEIDDEDLALLEASWGKIDEPCRELLKLHYYGKTKLAEIAEQQQRSPAAVRKQKERCVDKLRSILMNTKKMMER